MTYQRERHIKTRGELLNPATCIVTMASHGHDWGRKIHEILVSHGLPASLHIVSDEEFDQMDEDAPGAFYVNVPASVATAWREAKKSPARPKNRGLQPKGWSDFEWLAEDTARRLAA